MVNAKTLALGSLTAALAMASVLFMITTVGAQGTPPGPPGLFYGPVSGGPEPGDAIVAFVDGTRTLNCGAGEVLEDEDGNTVYVIDVLGHVPGDHSGCGTEGAQVRFYFPNTKQFANQTGTWSIPDEADDLEPLALTAGASLSREVFAPNAASDKPID